MVKRPNLALLLSGTPAMLPRLIPSTENGLFSRILMYRIPGSGTYRPLTSADDSPAASEYFESWGQRVLDIGVFSTTLRPGSNLVMPNVNASIVFRARVLQCPFFR